MLLGRAASSSPVTLAQPPRSPRSRGRAGGGGCVCAADGAHAGRIVCPPSAHRHQPAGVCGAACMRLCAQIPFVCVPQQYPQTHVHAQLLTLLRYTCGPPGRLGPPAGRWSVGHNAVVHVGKASSNPEPSQPSAEHACIVLPNILSSASIPSLCTSKRQTQTRCLRFANQTRKARTTERPL